MTETLVAELDGARQHFLELVGDIRPELHRYCSRIVGSIVDGEDIVQDTLAKAFYAMSMATEIPPLRPWLFRIAHNAAIDHLRRYEHKHVDSRGDFEDASDAEPMDPSVTRAALASFLELPVIQRSAVILKDVLGHTVEEAAETMGTTVPAVKSALVRGRARMRQTRSETPTVTIDPAERGRLANYVALFNARDWDALRALIGDECRLDLVTRAERRGKQIHGYFERYAADTVRLEIGSVDGRAALLAYTSPDARRPSYFMRLDWDGDRLAAIRDFRYVPYLLGDT